eukprot:Skav220427  [mRNA]  locus=scaffold639:786906:787439:+ [translate_table: standard]
MLRPLRLPCFTHRFCRQTRVDPNRVTYNAALNSFGVMEWQWALKSLETMLTRSLEPDVISYSAALLRAKWLWAVELLDQMIWSKVSPNIFSYNAVLVATAGRSQWQQVLCLFHAARALPGGLDALSFSCALAACAAAGKAMLAAELLGLVAALKLKNGGAMDGHGWGSHGWGGDGSH